MPGYQSAPSWIELVSAVSTYLFPAYKYMEPLERCIVVNPCLGAKMRLHNSTESVAGLSLAFSCVVIWWERVFYVSRAIMSSHNKTPAGLATLVT